MNREIGIVAKLVQIRTLLTLLLCVHRRADNTEMVHSFKLIEEKIISSAVPVQLVPSMWQAFHEGIARVAASMSLMMSAFSSTLHLPEEGPPARCRRVKLNFGVARKASVAVSL